MQIVEEGYSDWEHDRRGIFGNSSVIDQSGD